MNGLNTKKILETIRLRRRNLMRLLGNDTLKLFQVENFDAQGFINDGVEKWKPVRSKKPGQKIGIRTGRMRRSGRSTIQSNSRAEVSFNAPYSSYFNKRRRLVGESATANRRSRSIITRFYNRILQ